MRKFTFCLLAGGICLASGAAGFFTFEVEAQSREPMRDLRPATRSELIHSLINTRLSATIRDASLRDVIDFIAVSANVQIVARFDDQRLFDGLDPNATVTLDLRDTTLLTAIETLIDQIDTLEQPATWQVREGFIEIGTKERLNMSRRLEVYAIRDLTHEVPMFDNAPRLNLDAALQGGGSGGNVGGGGLGGGGGSGGIGNGGIGNGGNSGRGGSIFDPPGDDPDRDPLDRRADELLEIIISMIEPLIWVEAGGLAASIRHYRGHLIVNAPDYVHRQIAGYE